MRLYEVIWVAEGVALIEASSASEAREAFYEDRDVFTDEYDSLTVTDVLESYDD